MSPRVTLPWRSCCHQLANASQSAGSQSCISVIVSTLRRPWLTAKPAMEATAARALSVVMARLWMDAAPGVGLA